MNQEQIERYVVGRMSEAEALVFEEYCLANPEFARQVEYEQRLKVGLAQVASGSTAEFVRSESPLRWSLAAAAGLLVAVVAVLSIWNSGAHAPAATLLAAVSDGTPHTSSSLRLALVRGSENVPALPPGLVRVEIVGLFEAGNLYSVALDRREQNHKIDTIATLNDQRPTSPMSLEVVIDGKQLRPGPYSLRVRKQASGEEALDFGFVKF
jgi:hypothetical protein